MGQLGKQGVDGEQPSPQDQLTFPLSEGMLAQMRVPVLLPGDDPHARLCIAALDGTGNSMLNDKPENWSAVARIYDQIEKTKPARIASGYVEGTFTQEGLFRAPKRWLDGRFGHSFDERLETAYYDFCKQAAEWLKEDPEARIHLAGVGFSRGSEAVAALQRMVEERGIRDPEGAVLRRDRDGVIQKIEYADRPLLVAPGRTLQVALLYDPVATGVRDEERVIPGSNLGTLEISALRERRDLFPDNDHLPPGFSEDRRNLNIGIAASHSDAGGTYARNGLGTLSFNLGVDFLNALGDEPYLRKQALPGDASQYVIHRSDQHMLGLYGTRGYDRDGVRDREEDQSPRAGIQRKDPINPVLESQVERRNVRIGPVPHAQDRQQEQENAQSGPQASIHGAVRPSMGADTPRMWDSPTSLEADPAAFVERMLAAARDGDTGAFRQLTARAAYSDAGRELREHALATVDLMEQAQSQVRQRQEPTQALCMG